MNKHLLLAVTLASSSLALPACKSAGTDPAVRSAIGAKLESAQAPIQDCYQKSLYTHRKLRGMYVAQLTVDGTTGQFGAISLRRDEPNDPVLRYCVISELAKLRLDKPPGQKVLVDSVPIKFEWAAK